MGAFSRWAAVSLLTPFAGMLLLTGGCGPTDVSKENAALWIEEQRLPAPVESFAYRLDGAFRHSLLDSCADAGLLTIERNDGDVEVKLTAMGRQHFSRTSVARIGDAYQVSLYLENPIPSEVVRVTAIRTLHPRKKKIGYTWRYICPPVLESCTALDGKPRTDTVELVYWTDFWKVM